MGSRVKVPQSQTKRIEREIISLAYFEKGGKHLSLYIGSIIRSPWDRETLPLQNSLGGGQGVMGRKESD